MRGVRLLILVATAALAGRGATLERLSLEEMAAKSTAIVRGRVAASWAAAHGPLIYTHYAIRVSERWKGPAAAQIEVVVPGGTAGGLRQSFSGVPRLSAEGEYVLFLWSGPSGLTHIIGLTQGVFDIRRDAEGALVAARAAASETLLDPATGRPVQDEPLRLKLEELGRRVRTALGAGAVR